MPRDFKYWLKKNLRLANNGRGGKKSTREKELEENQWGSKVLFEELFLQEPTQGSQFYMYQRVQRGDGVFYIPRRVLLEDILSFDLSTIDEGDSFTSYLPNQIYDEGDATTTYNADEIYEEGSAETNYQPNNPFL